VSLAEERRAEMAASWERAAAGWSRRADDIRSYGMPVSARMVEHLELQPGQRVLELAAGPGDTGFMAAELVRPGGTLVSSDGSDAMLELARSRAAAQGIDNVEFRQLQLEWIDLPIASVDAVLCRWGVMLCLDPAAALQECRRVLVPGGRLAIAVWDLAERNPWATIAGGALIGLGHLPPPDPSAPGMFVLSAPGRLEHMLVEAGFVEPVVEAVSLPRAYPSIEAWLGESRDLSMVFGEAWRALDEAQRAGAAEEIARRAAPFTRADGSVELPGSSLVAFARA
jgi:SAM-dependent methyltransferase